VRRIDLAVLSHAHRDHFGGLPWLARRGWLGFLIENGSPRLSGVRGRLRSSIGARGGALIALARDSTLLLSEGDTLRLLGASRPEAGGRTENADENDRSLVATLAAGGYRVLLPGDVEAGAERALAPLLSPAAVLKAPHHGSDTSCDPAFLAAVRPRLALVSCGEGNRFGHPARETLGRLERLGTRVLRTDREGEIRVTLDSLGIWVSTRAHPAPERIAGPSRPALSP
jgi:competence protein ComEC